MEDIEGEGEVMREEKDIIWEKTNSFEGGEGPLLREIKEGHHLREKKDLI